LVRLVCAYCGSEVVFERFSVRAADYRAELEAYESRSSETVQVDGLGFELGTRIAEGHSSEVFLASRPGRLSERLVVKRLFAAEDEPLLAHEQRVLEALEQSSARGSAYFTTLLPQRVCTGRSIGPAGREVPLAVFREPAGFAHTLAQVKLHFPAGIDPRHAVWLWRRLLGIVGWLHDSGFVHGALLPEHVLVDAREHAARLVGFSAAGPLESPTAVWDPRYPRMYPEAVLDGAPRSSKSDLEMLARLVKYAVTSDRERAPSVIPVQLADFLEQQAAGNGPATASEVDADLTAVARDCFGRPSFVALELP
jgi:hypothetical protein